jgi:rhodanese-related sulfurtransferase
MQRRLALALVALATIATGCTRKTSDRDVVFLEPDQALARSHESPGLFGGERRPVWVDPRTPEHYAECHIAGAISLPFPRMSAEAPVVLRGYDMFFVYGTSHEDTIAKAASKRLMELGFDDVYTLKGGLEKWKADGLEVVSNPSTKPAGAPAQGAPAAAPAAAPMQAAPTSPASNTRPAPSKAP